MSSNPDSPEYEAIVYYKIGISGSSREAVSSFVVKIKDDTTVGQLEDDLSDKLTKAGLEVGAEFVPNLLHHFYDLMNEDHDENQAEPGAGERPAGD